jgi:hypothetical protein
MGVCRLDASSMERELVSSQSVNAREHAPTPGTMISRWHFALYDVPSTNGACFPGLGNAFRENPPKLPSGWAFIQEALAFESFVTLC